MRFRFQKIGPIEDADLELGDLTVIAGRNNTGKTYIVYTLYGFLRNWREFARRLAPSKRQPLFGASAELQDALSRSADSTASIDRARIAQIRDRALKDAARFFSLRGISTVAPTTTVIALSKTSHLAVLRQTAGAHWNKICDYLLVDETNGECRATLVELKSTLQRKSEALEQLRRSLPMVRYLLSVCSIEADTHWDPTVTYALIAERQTNRIDKQPTRPRAGRLDRERYGQIDVDIFVGAAVRAQHLGFS